MGTPVGVRTPAPDPRTLAVMTLRLTALATQVRPALALLLGVLAATVGLSAAAGIVDGTASLAIIAATALLVITAAVLATVAPPRTLTVGARSRAHREALSSIPEPTHPDTAGRVRSRAPGKAAQAA